MSARARILTLGIAAALLLVLLAVRFGSVESAGKVALPHAPRNGQSLSEETGHAAPVFSSSERLEAPSELRAPGDDDELGGNRDPRILVLEADRRPLQGCLVAIVGENDVEAVTTDTEGVALYSGLFDRGVVYVRHPKRAALAFPWRAEVDLSALESVVQLPPVQEVEGVVQVDGAPPPRALEVTLHQEPYDYGPLEAPERLASLLGVERGDLFRIRCATAPDGAFRFEGIPPDWRGKLVVHGAYALTGPAKPRSIHEGHNEVLLQAPQAGLFIELTSLPCIQGRIVTSDGTEGVPHAAIMAFVHAPKLDVPDQGIVADAQGRFEVPLPSPDFLRVRLEFGDAQWRGRKELVFAREDVPLNLDLGDLALADRQLIKFRALSTLGEPIEGASALAPDGADSGVKTDLDGRGVVELPLGTSSFSVLAAGYTTRTVPLAGIPLEDSPLEVVLETATMLRACVRIQSSRAREASAIEAGTGSDPAGGTLAGLRIRLSSEGPLFVTGNPWTPPTAELAFHGSTFYSSSSGPQGGYALFGLNEADCLVLQSLAPGTPIGLRLEDRLGVSGYDVLLPPLVEGEQREVGIDLERVPQLVVRVVDEEGGPLPTARVTIRAAGDRGLELKTDPKGECFVRGIFAKDLNLSALAHGFAPLTWSGALPSGERPEIELVALRGKNVMVHVRDELGTSLMGGSLETRSHGSALPIAAEEVGVGIHALRNLPAGPLDVELSIGAGRYVRTHDSEVPDLTFELPVHGRVLAQWKLDAGPEPDPKVFRIALRPLDPGRTELVENYASEILHGRHDFDPVLPGKYTLHLEATSEDGRRLELVAPALLTVHTAQTTSIELTPAR